MPVNNKTAAAIFLRSALTQLSYSLLRLPLTGSNTCTVQLRSYWSEWVQKHTVCNRAAAVQQGTFFLFSLQGRASRERFPQGMQQTQCSKRKAWTLKSTTHHQKVFILPKITRVTSQNPCSWPSIDSHLTYQKPATERKQGTKRLTDPSKVTG